MLADFVAQQILAHSDLTRSDAKIRILDPAVGEGSLLCSLLQQVDPSLSLEVHGYDTDEAALLVAADRLSLLHPNADFHFHQADYVAGVVPRCSPTKKEPRSLFEPKSSTPAEARFDVIIANPPYVRTQVLGADYSKSLARRFGLKGRVDLYHAFILAIAESLAPNGTLGLIVSNRFMTTKTGASVRQAFFDNFTLRHVWDLGDTKVFDAAVLPAVIVANGTAEVSSSPVGFTAAYETKDKADRKAEHVVAALTSSGIAEVPDGRRIQVQSGVLGSRQGSSVWRISTDDSDEWLRTVRRHTWRTFGHLGKIRVGVKTCADKVYIRNDWHKLPPANQPEALRPLTTHHIASRFHPASAKNPFKVVYTHHSKDGKRKAIELAKHPKTKAYLEEHRATLEGRKYVVEAGRQWFEIWVPQDPDAWEEPKLVFRDISERPCFWMDLEKTVVNGDCYWIKCDNRGDRELLWLALGVANSTFIEKFYDLRFNNKLYAGRRRFITQYVREFPLPDPSKPSSRRVAELAREIYRSYAEGRSGPEVNERALDEAVFECFGLQVPQNPTGR